MNCKTCSGITFSIFVFLATLSSYGQPSATDAASISNAVVAQISVPTNAIIRINAGGPILKDTKGNEWAADAGFTGGEVYERPEVTVTNSDMPDLFRTERYGMDSFSWPLANGKYTVKLFFCEAYEGITGPGQRVFGLDVAGKHFDKFDVWAKAGGPYKAYVETVPVEVTNGKLLITFTTDVENPQINGIEIMPRH